MIIEVTRLLQKIWEKIYKVEKEKELILLHQ